MGLNQSRVSVVRHGDDVVLLVSDSAHTATALLSVGAARIIAELLVITADEAEGVVVLTDKDIIK